MDFVVSEIFFVVGTRCGNMVIGGQPGPRPVSQVGWVDHGSTRALNFFKNCETTSFHFL